MARARAHTLGPLAGVKTNLQKGVLADALRAFATEGGGDLKMMIVLLADLPEGISEIGNADKLAAKMADELKAAVATNPLLKATGPVLDPKLLFFGRNSSKYAYRSSIFLAWHRTRPSRTSSIDCK